MVTDSAGKILRVNRTFCTWVGRAPDELVGKQKLSDLFTMGGRIFHQTHWQPALQMQGSLAEVKFDIRTQAGVVLPMMLNAVRMKVGEAHVDIVTLTVAEERNKYERELLAARKRADELVDKERASQLVLADRAVFAEQLIGIVSHDLRNPLSAILVGATLLETRQDLSQPRRAKLIGTVISSARAARRLIEDLLDFTMARLGRGLTVKRQRADLHALVARVVDNLSLAFPGRTLQHAAVGAGDISVDGDRLSQLLGNLVGNAMAYGDVDKPVTVVSEVTETLVKVSVHNFGPPIPPEVLSNMFEPMVRGQPADGATRSVGLGLYIVRAIAEAHGGEVRVTSTAETGTTFLFSFAPL